MERVFAEVGRARPSNRFESRIYSATCSCSKFAPSCPCPFYCLLFAFLFFLVYLLLLFLLFFNHDCLGATLDLAQLWRKPSQLDCHYSLIPAHIWDMLLATTNDDLVQKLSIDKVKRHRRYTPIKMEELKSVFFARLEMISRGARTIDEATRFFLSLAFFSYFLVLNSFF